MTINKQDVADLSAWIDSLVKTQAPARPAPLPEPPDEANALVVIATKVSCRTCGNHHISSSHILKRVPRKDGSVFYKPARFTCVGLPHVVEWAVEEIDACWRCFDLAERLLDPTANLQVAPTRVEFEPTSVELPLRDAMTNQSLKS